MDDAEIVDDIFCLIDLERAHLWALNTYRINEETCHDRIPFSGLRFIRIRF